MRRALIVFLLVLIGLPPLLAWLVLDDTPALEPPSRLQRDDLVWVKSLFEKHDPRRLAPDTVQSIRLDEAELNRLLDYTVEIRPVYAVSAVLVPNRADVTASLQLPANPFGRYLNLTTEVEPTADGIALASLQLGSLPLPGFLADNFARLGHRLLRRDSTYAALADAFQRVHIDEGEATLDYRWEPELLGRLERKGAELLIPEADKRAMLVYADHLKTLLAPHPVGSTVPLVQILPRLFAQPPPESDDRINNRAAFTALAAYLAGVSLPHLFEDDTAPIRRAPGVNLTLHGRRDFAEHLIISAALTANAGSRFANAIGLIKEEQDAGGGSGFSFTDLASNHAGVRLGERAIGEHATALRQRIAAVRADIGLVPNFQGLPEFMPQADFDRRFGPVGSPRYQAVIRQIDARLDAHPLLGR